MSRVILITGGQRSGKSLYAERLAQSLTPTPVYVATAHIWDEDFRQRVAKHQARRGKQWTTLEEERHLSRLPLAGRVALVDCLTLWATNFLPTDALPNVDETIKTLTAELDSLCAKEDATLILVTNEIGLGGTSPNALQRRFADIMGAVNQHAATLADEVILMVSGIAVKIKD